MFYENIELNKKEKNIFTKNIERIELTYMLTQETMNIQAFISEEYKYDGIMIITVNLRGNMTNAQIRLFEQLIHNAIPHPTVLTLVRNDKISISTCLKRLNKVNKQEIVLETIHRSDFFAINDKDEVIESFLDDLHISKLSFSNFFTFYKDIDIAVKAFQNSVVIGTYRNLKDEKERIKLEQIIEQIVEKQQEIDQYKRELKKESQFNKKVEINMKMQQLKKELDRLQNKVRSELGWIN